MTTFGILVATALLLFTIQVIGLINYRNSIKYAQIMKVACAGSEKPHTPKELKVTNIHWNDFLDDKGRPLKKEKFHTYIINGQSMLLGGIQDNDIIFVDNQTDINKLSFPIIMALHREQIAMNKAAQYGDKAEIKIRRTWDKCELTDKQAILKLVSNIIDSDKFKRLRNIDVTKFPTKEWLLVDLQRRLDRYCEEHPNHTLQNHKDHTILISTTLDTNRNIVHFSIHSSGCVIGEVKYAFGINNNIEAA